MSSGDNTPCVKDEEKAEYIVFIPVPPMIRTMLEEQRRAHLMSANSISKVLALPEVCPCCGRKT